MTDSVKEITAYDESTKTHHRRVTHDVEHIIDDNTDVRNNGRNGFSPERTFRKIGSIPMIFLNEALKEGINLLDGSPEAAAWIKRFLENNPKFRTVDNILTPFKGNTIIK